MPRHLKKNGESKGYSEAERKHWFKPGHDSKREGNGRKGSKDIKTVIKALFDSEVTIHYKDPTAKDPSKADTLKFTGTGLQAIAFRQFIKACNGSDTAIKTLFDRAEGKPAQTNINVEKSYEDYLKEALKPESKDLESLSEEDLEAVADDE